MLWVPTMAVPAVVVTENPVPARLAALNCNPAELIVIDTLPVTLVPDPALKLSSRSP